MFHAVCKGWSPAGWFTRRLAAIECQTVSQAVAECFLYTSVFFQERDARELDGYSLPHFLLGMCKSVCKSRLDSVQAVTECLPLSHFLKHSTCCRWFLLTHL